MEEAAHKPAGEWYNMHLNMSGEMYMLRRAHAVRARYSAAYPTGAERMLRREMKTTVAIYCGNQV